MEIQFLRISINNQQDATL